MLYKQGALIFLKAGIPYWDKVPMNTIEGFDWKITQMDMIVLLVQRHDTHPVTFWKAITSADGNSPTYEGSKTFIFSEPLMNQFIHELWAHEVDSFDNSP